MFKIIPSAICLRKVFLHQANNFSHQFNHRLIQQKPFIYKSLGQKFSGANFGHFQKTFTINNSFRSRTLVFRLISYKCYESFILLGKNVGKQINFYACQKIRRTAQQNNFLLRLCCEQNLNFLINVFQNVKRFGGRSFGLIMGLTILTPEGITEEDYKGTPSKLNNIDNQKDLKLSKYERMCHKSLAESLKGEGWESVHEEKDLFVLKKKLGNSEIFEYKVLGSFFDIPPKVFFEVQLDMEYRKKWDKLVVELDVMDKNQDGSEIIRWVMKFPYPMFKREYVYLRKSMIDYQNNLMVLICKATEHPTCPPNKEYVRVDEYSSEMIIKPHKEIDDTGFDYILTYFDDPKASYTMAYNWMACKAAQDFVVRLHKAAQELYLGKKSQSVKPSSLPNSNQPQEQQYVYA